MAKNPETVTSFLRKNWILWVILLVATLLRFWGLNFGLPQLSRPDEQNISNIVVNSMLASGLQTGHWDLNPHFFEYPTLYFYILLPLYYGYYLWGHAWGWFSGPDAFLIHYLDSWTLFHMISRVVTALCSVATVWVMYRLGKEVSYLTTFGFSGLSLKGEGAKGELFGLLAAGLMAVTYLHVRDSHFGVTDVPATLLMTLCLWKCAQALGSGQIKPLYWASVFAGLAASTKYPAGLVFVSVLCAFPFLRRTLKQKVTELLNCVAITIASFLAVSPFIVLDFPKFWADFSFQQAHLRDGHLLDVGIGWIFHAQTTLWYGLGGVACLAALLGIVFCLRQAQQTRDWRLVFLLWPLTLLTYGLLGNTRTVFIRYMMPMLPMLVLYAVFGVLWLSQKLAGGLKPAPTIKDVTPVGAGFNPPAIHKRNGQLILPFLFALLILQPLLYDLRMDALFAAPDTRNQAREWLLAHLGPKDAVGIGFPLCHLEMPYRIPKVFLGPIENENSKLQLRGREFYPSNQVLFSGEPTKQNQFKLSTYLYPKALNDLGLRYLMVAHSPLVLFNAPDYELQGMAKQYKLAAHFSPVAPGGNWPQATDYDQLDAYYLPYAQFADLRQAGPEIWIYAVPTVQRTDHPFLARFAK